MCSKLPGAIAFEEWVTEKVLPTIRETGGAYLTEQKAEELINNPDLVIGLAQQVEPLRVIPARFRLNEKDVVACLVPVVGPHPVLVCRG